MSRFFYNIADKNACFLINYKILVTNTPQWSSLNENSFCKTEKENLPIYSLTINGNEAETKVKGS